MTSDSPGELGGTDDRLRDWLHLATARRELALEPSPRPVMVRLFGGLDIEVDGRQLTFGRKVPTIPLAVLKVLAISARPLSTTRLMACVWSSGGRVSRGSLDTALYRLRRLLGVETAVDMSGAHVTLASEVCWTDVGAFEAVCQRIATLRRDRVAVPERIARCEERLLQLYRGPLGEDGDPPVVLRARERLARDFTRAVSELQHLWTAVEPERARALVSFHASRVEA